MHRRQRQDKTGEGIVERQQSKKKMSKGELLCARYQKMGVFTYGMLFQVISLAVFYTELTVCLC